MLKLAIHGAAGRMGRVLLRMIDEAPDLSLAQAIEREGHPELGCDVSELIGGPERGAPLRSMPEKPDADVMIDFSLPEGMAELVRRLKITPLPLISGTTGLGPEEMAELRLLSGLAPVVWAPNFSTGVNLLFDLVGRSADVLGKEAEVEITELHHRHKKDAPSGTALRLSRIVAEGRGEVVHGRSGETGERPPGQVGVHALRGGDVTGEHTVYFFSGGERLELTHRAPGREAFASGALRAARWITGRAPGFYDMSYVLGLRPGTKK